jgi:CRP-like cAMP-binding protein
VSQPHPTSSRGGAALFAGLSPEDHDTLTGLAVPREIQRDATLFRLGDDATEFFVVESGAVVLTMPIEMLGQQQETFVEEVGPGGMFGWSALVAPHHYTMGARASQQTLVQVWHGPAFRQALEERPAARGLVLDNLCRLMCRRLLAMQAMWLRELHRNLSSRLASASE